MNRALLVLLPFLCAWLTPQQDIGWLKLDQAKALASHTNKLILVYVACDPKSGSAPCSGGTMERVFADAALARRQEDFYFVRVGEKKTAQLVKATKPPEAIVLDSDGDEIYRGSFTDVASLEQVMGAAQGRLLPREPHWASEIAPSPGGRALLVVAFDDDKGDALKPFEDKLLVKFHDRIEFVRYPAKKDSEAAKKWGVTQGPAIFICDAANDKPEKNALEKLTGKKTPAQLKASLQKALLRLEPAKK